MVGCKQPMMLRSNIIELLLMLLAAASNMDLILLLQLLRSIIGFNYT